jgi:hypothetical protein
MENMLHRPHLVCEKGRKEKNILLTLLFHKRVAEAFQIFFRDAHILPKLLSYEKNVVTGDKSIAAWS